MRVKPERLQAFREALLLHGERVLREWPRWAPHVAEQARAHAVREQDRAIARQIAGACVGTEHDPCLMPDNVCFPCAQAVRIEVALGRTRAEEREALARKRADKP